MRNIFFRTFQTLINLCLLRASPAELPYSTVFLYFLVLAELSINALNLSKLKDISLAEVFTATILSLVFLIGIIYFLLAKRKLQGRLHKVLIAWFGTELLLLVLVKALMVVMPESMLTSKNTLVFIEVMYVTWNILIKSQIIKRSIESKLTIAILITFGIILVSDLPIQFVLVAYLPELQP